MPSMTHGPTRCVLTLVLASALSCDAGESKREPTPSPSPEAGASPDEASSAGAEPPQAPGAEPRALRKPIPLKLSVSAEGCSLMGGEPRDCAELCEDSTAFETADAAIIEASDDAKTQLSTLVACLEAKQISTSVRGDAVPAPAL